MRHAVARALCGLSVCATVAVCTLYAMKAAPQSGDSGRSHDNDASPIYGITVPAEFRDWRLISIGELGASDRQQLRAQLGNDIAIEAIRSGKLPFPDGAIIAALHWNKASSDENDKVLAVGFPGVGLQSFVAGSAVNVQFMVKDSKKYAVTGGWGFADFTNGKPGDEALHQTCYPCHLPAKDRDFVFAHYAPNP